MTQAGGGGGAAEKCVAKGKCQGLALTCTSAASCTNGDVCCLSFGGGGGTSGATCKKTCGGGGGGGGGGVQLCGSDSECPQGDTCESGGQIAGGLKTCRRPRPDGGAPPPFDAGGPPNVDAGP